MYFLNDLYGYTTEYQAFCQFHISFTHGQIEYANNIDFGEWTLTLAENVYLNG